MIGKDRDRLELNRSALEPLSMPLAFRNAHRQRAERDGIGPKVVKPQRPSPILIANNLRAPVRDFRDAQYADAADTSGELLFHWFETNHPVLGKDGVTAPFRCYFETYGKMRGKAPNINLEGICGQSRRLRRERGEWRGDSRTETPHPRATDARSRGIKVPISQR